MSTKKCPLGFRVGWCLFWGVWVQFGCNLGEPCGNAIGRLGHRARGLPIVVVEQAAEPVAGHTGPSRTGVGGAPG